MKVPSTTWLIGSRMKRVISRGPSCEEASVNVTSVIENTRLATVIIEPAMVASTWRAPSVPTGSSQCNGRAQAQGTKLSRVSIANASTIAPKIITPGTSQRLELSRYQR